MNVSDVSELGRPWAEAIIAKVYEHGRKRHQNFGPGFSEIDFLFGAAAAMEALGLWKYVPAGWFLLPVVGHTVIPDAPEYDDAQELHWHERRCRDIRSANSWSWPGDVLAEHKGFGDVWSWLIVRADGYGGAWVVESDGRNTMDGYVYHERHFDDEHEAVTFANWLAPQGDWDKGEGWTEEIYAELEDE